jgi:hypothetical protein
LATFWANFSQTYLVTLVGCVPVSIDRAAKIGPFWAARVNDTLVHLTYQRLVYRHSVNGLFSSVIWSTDIWSTANWSIDILSKNLFSTAILCTGILLYQLLSINFYLPSFIYQYLYANIFI